MEEQKRIVSNALEGIQSNDKVIFETRANEFCIDFFLYYANWANIAPIWGSMIHQDVIMTNKLVQYECDEFWELKLSKDLKEVPKLSISLDDFIQAK